MTKWQQILFKDAPFNIIDGDRGKSYPKQSDFQSQGSCLFLNANNVTLNGFNLSNCQFINEYKDNQLGKGKLQRYDIVLTTRGTVGNTAYFDDDIPFTNIRINSGMVIIRPNKDVIIPRFLYLFLRSNLFKNEVKAFTTGSAQPQLPIRDLKQFTLLLPPLPEQRAIAEMLGSLDDKIEANRRENETLEATARAIFKSWFVDFDPVHAKSRGELPVGMDEETAQLFPDAFVESELGLIPQGWRVDTFDKIVDIIGGGTPKTSISEYWDGDIPWFSVKDVPNETDIFVIDTEKNITRLGVDNSSTKILPELTTIISARGTVGKLALTGVGMAMNQSCYAVRGKNYPDFFTYFNLKTQIIELQQQTHGTVFDTITRNTFSNLKIVLPPSSIADIFEEDIKTILERIKNNVFEVRALAETRDALLSKLMSGEVRAPHP